MLRLWEEKHLPGDWRDANIVTIFKKGDKRQCGNYRGISLLSIAGKVLARIILRRLQILAEDILPESQCGFHSNRGTIDMIFCARQLQEKSKEQQRPLYFIYYDLEKAFDSVPRVAMWSILERFGCPPTLVSIIRSFHDDMIGKVVHNNHTTETFPITCGLKQGCVLAPTMFSIYLAAMLYELPPNNPSIDMRYHIDSSLFNTAGLRSARHTTVFSLNNLQFADDMATVASSPEDLERSVRNFTSAYERFDLTVNVGKTKVLIQNTLENEEPIVNIQIRGEEVEHVTQFSYLGAVLSAEATSGKDVEKRIQAANVAYGRLGKRVFHNRDLLRTTKLMVYKAVVLTMLLYGCETWTLYKEDLKKLERSHQRKLRAIMNIRWQDKLSNISVLNRGCSQSIEAIVALHRLR